MRRVSPEQCGGGRPDPSEEPLDRCDYSMRRGKSTVILIDASQANLASGAGRQLVT